MQIPRQLRHFALFASGTLASTAAAQGVPQLTVFGIDYKGRTISLPDSFSGVPITEADLLLPQGLLPQLGPLLTPGIAETGGVWPQGGLALALHAAAVGHAPQAPGMVEVDAISHGLDRRIPRQNAGPGGGIPRFAFSVGRASLGIAGLPSAPNVHTERGCQAAAADVYRDLGFGLLPVGPAAAPAGNTLIADGNGLATGNPLGCLSASFVGLGLLEDKSGTNVGGPDNLDALDGDVPDQWLPRATRTYFSLDAAFIDPDGLQPNTGSAAAHGWSGGDILYAEPDGTIGLYASASSLGLDILGADKDDVDALALCENGIAGFQRNHAPFDWLTGASDMLLFSVRRGSQVIGSLDCVQGLPIEPGDILMPPLPGYSVPGILVAAEALGLHTFRSGALVNIDDLDALDTLHDAPMVQEYCGSTSDQPLPCPCGNSGAPGRGCGNSVNPLGAKCWANGTPSISADTLLISGSGMPFAASTTLVQGTSATAPTPFGDGLRCVSGNQRRLYTRNCFAGNIQYGAGVPGTGLVSSTGGVVAPGTRYYQIFYRNAPVYCTPSTTNTTNALAVAWVP